MIWISFMTIKEYFGDWGNIIDIAEVDRILKRLTRVKERVCPHIKDIFKACTICPFKDLKVVILGQDPYMDIKNGIPTATGIAFGNSKETLEENYSPSLKILMESVIDYSYPHGTIIFDPSLEKWEKQGVLMLNSALSCIAGKSNSHSLMWRPFIRSFLTRLSSCRSGIVYMLMGNEAQSFEHCINKNFNYILKTKHPSWYARTHTNMPSDIWYEVNKLLYGIYGLRIEWYKEYNNLNDKENETVFYAGNK